MTVQELDRALAPLVDAVFQLGRQVSLLTVKIEEDMLARKRFGDQMEGVANLVANRMHNLGNVIQDANEIARDKK